MKRTPAVTGWVDVGGFALGVLTEALLHLRARPVRLWAVPPPAGVPGPGSAGPSDPPNGASLGDPTRRRRPTRRSPRPAGPRARRARPRPDNSPPRSGR